MDTITNMNNGHQVPDIERLLLEAGITHIVVDRCPLSTCEACHPAAGELALAQAAA